MSFETFIFRGQPAVRLERHGIGSCIVALHGAQLLSWIPFDGVERIYLSPQAHFDGQAAIRGGVPVCWPQFNLRGPLPKHGFVRNLPWQVESPSAGTSNDKLVLALRDSESTRKLWPHAFEARLSVRLARHSLRVALDVSNLGDAPWSFTVALHTYFLVDDIANIRLEGLQGARRWDSVLDEHQIEASPALSFGTEFDCVYASPPGPLRLVQPGGTLEITQSASCTETVVWNPGPDLSVKLQDLPDDGWRHMLCVEAARIDEAVRLEPGAHWQGWQQLTVLEAS
jgi:glucose-6-phosphate 1-epimerase